MQYTHLGRTGLLVSRLCLGTMNFGPETSEADSFTIMDRALEQSDYHRKRGEYDRFNKEEKTRRKGISLSVFFHGSALRALRSALPTLATSS